VLSYIVALVNYTRGHKDLSLGISPRGSISLMRAAMGLALLEGRDHVLPDDVQAMIHPVLAHRLVLSPQAHVQSATAEKILAAAVKATPVPAVQKL
jgi:MoxR-like ATPase